jgi:hypothetical protein
MTVGGFPGVYKKSLLDRAGELTGFGHYRAIQINSKFYIDQILSVNNNVIPRWGAELGTWKTDLVWRISWATPPDPHQRLAKAPLVPLYSNTVKKHRITQSISAGAGVMCQTSFCTSPPLGAAIAVLFQ